MTQIHETAVVSETANLAENVVVGPTLLSNQMFQ